MESPGFLQHTRHTNLCHFRGQSRDFVQQCRRRTQPEYGAPGFEVAGEDRVFYPAHATEDWNAHTVTVSGDKVNDIKAVRYCFKNFAIGKVKDMYGMPLIPFRTDNWDDAKSSGESN